MDDGSKAALGKIFDKYREDPKEEPNEINVEGTMQMMQDLGVDVADVGSFVFAELVKSPSLGKMVRSEFVKSLSTTGWVTLRAIAICAAGETNDLQCKRHDRYQDPH